MPDLYDNLRDKTVLVTGASLGIGAALSRRLGETGAYVICAARTRSRIDDVVNDIRTTGGRARAISTDVTDAAQMQALAMEIDAEIGGLDIAFLNAGGNWQKDTIEHSDVDEWKSAVELNLHSVFYGIKFLAPLMRKRGGGRIFITGSAMAHYAAAKHSSYCAAKAGARMVMNTAVQELMADNITINEFVPGPTRTLQALKGVEDDKASPFNNPSEWVKEPEDVVDLMLTMAAYPGMGPTGQTFSLARR